jgi:hypothetical protein
MTRLLMTIDAAGGVWRYAMDLARGLRAQGVETAFLGFGPRPRGGGGGRGDALGPLDWSDAPLDWMAGGRRCGRRRAADHRRRGAARAGPDRAGERAVAGGGAAADLAGRGGAPFLRATWFRAVRGTPLPERGPGRSD